MLAGPSSLSRSQVVNDRATHARRRGSEVGQLRRGVHAAMGSGEFDAQGVGGIPRGLAHERITESRPAASPVFVRLPWARVAPVMNFMNPIETSARLTSHREQKDRSGEDEWIPKEHPAQRKHPERHRL